MSNLTLRQLQSIRSIARTGRINQSADELGLTPPAITLQLRQVELDLGAPLFDRTRAGLVPTAIGQLVTEAADEVSERLRIMEEEVRAMIDGRAGRVRLGAVSTAKYFIPKMIAAFGHANPKVEVRLLVGNRSETINRLRHQELDIVIMGRPPRDIAVTAAAMGDHPFVLIASPHHPLAEERNIPKSRLAEETFLLRERGSGTRSSLELFFGELPDKSDNLGVEMGSNESIKQAAMAGLGIALLSAHTVAAEVGQGWLRILDVEGMPIIRQWYAVLPTRRSANAATLALRDFLTGEGAAMLPDIKQGYTP